MVRYILLIAVFYLIVDHLYTHWGPSLINWVASKVSGKEVSVVEGSPYKESLIDRVKKVLEEKFRR